MKKVQLLSELERLFKNAKLADEFSFVNVLIGYNGMGDQRFMSHLYESERLIVDIEKLIEATSDKHTKTRLGLLLYGHIFEMDELYNILGNLLRIATGQNLKYIPDLYNRYGKDEITPTEKFKRLAEHAQQCHFDGFIKELQGIYFNRIRNAFAHSSYSLVDDEFFIIKGSSVIIDGVDHRSISIENVLLPIIDQASTFISKFFQLLKQHRLSYKENKLITGSLSQLEPILILGNQEDGLIGFESFSGSSIKIRATYGTDRFIEAWNIRLTDGCNEHNALFEEIEYYNSRRPSGNNFEELKDKVLATGEQYLIRNLSVTVYNYANNTFKSGEAKPIAQREHVMNAALPYYDLAIEIDPSFGKAYLNRAISKLKLETFKETITNAFRKQLLDDIAIGLEYDTTMFEGHLNSGMLLMEIAHEETDIEKKIIEITQAIQKFKKVIELNPNIDFVYERIATCYWELANLDEKDKLNHFRDSIDYIKKALQRDDGLSNQLLYASILADFGDVDEENTIEYYGKSIKVLNDLDDKYGDNYEIKYRLANKYMSLSLHNQSLEDCEKALSLYLEALELNSSEAKIQNNLGFCLLQKSNFLENKEDSLKALENAILALNDAISIDENDFKTHLNLGIAYIEKYKISTGTNKEKFLDTAIISLKSGDALDTGSCAIQLSRIYALKGDVEKSILWLRKGLKYEKNLKLEDILEMEDFSNLRDVKDI